MALPNSGPLSLSQIADEFGGSTPHSLSEYYGVADGVPGSGAISVSDFYGKFRLPELGEAFQGGYFAGYISHTADSVPTHGLIIAPRVPGDGYAIDPSIRWGISNDVTVGAYSQFDGAANTALMSNANHPAANFCATLNFGGYSDWYLPAWAELQIAWYNLKGGITANNTTSGANPYSVPRRDSNSTASDPPQTTIPDFISPSGDQAHYGSIHWSSTEDPSTGLAFYVQMANGFINTSTFLNKTSSNQVRAFRKFAL